jgi:hypothetical protein
MVLCCKVLISDLNKQIMSPASGQHKRVGEAGLRKGGIHCLWKIAMQNSLN